MAVDGYVRCIIIRIDCVAGKLSAWQFADTRASPGPVLCMSLDYKSLIKEHGLAGTFFITGSMTECAWRINCSTRHLH